MIYVHCAHHLNTYTPYSYGLLLAYAKKMLPAVSFDLSLRIIETSSDIGKYFVKDKQNILLCSNYVWNVKENLSLCRKAKEFDKNCITIHGGPSTPMYRDACEEFHRKHPEVDFAVRGEGEEVLVLLLQAIFDDVQYAQSIDGVSYLRNGKIFYPPSPRHIDDLDQLPSPFLTGVFDVLDISKWEYPILETNRGCMYSCSYCSWDQSPFRKFNIDRVRAEIDWLGRNQLRTIFISDANFGMLKRDFEIACEFSKIKKKYGFLQAVYILFAKDTKREVIPIVSMLTKSGLMCRAQISLQTRDANTLKIVNRKNIKIEELEKLAEAFKREGLNLCYEIMLGLPGSTVETFLDDLEYCFDQPGTIEIFPTMLLPNSPMAEPSYQKKYDLKVDDEGLIASTSTLSEEDMKKLKKMIPLYHLLHPYLYNLLYYPMMYLRHDCAIKIPTLLNSLVSDLSSQTQFPLLTHIMHDKSLCLIEHAMQMYGEMYDNGQWDNLLREFQQWALTAFKIPNIKSFEQTILAQYAVLPIKNKAYPHTIPLLNNVAAWEKNILKNSKFFLCDYSAAEFVVDKPFVPYSDLIRHAVLPHSV